MADLRGSITVTKRLRQHAIWDREPFSYGQAWIDLLLLANDSPRPVTINGEVIQLERGQLAWSQRKLEGEWKRSGEWVARFLRFCQDETMIVITSKKNRGTIISVLNYDTYNPLPTVTDSVTEPGSETVTDSVTEPEWKGEVGIGSRKGEAKTPPKEGFAEMPSEAEVLAFAQAFPGDLTRGIPATIPEAWALGWLAHRSRPEHGKKWREKMRLDFVSDWVSGQPKARGQGLSGLTSAATGQKKNGGQTPGRSPAQARFELSRELEAVQERLDAAHDNNGEPRAADVKRERELKQLIRELPQ